MSKNLVTAISVAAGATAWIVLNLLHPDNPLASGKHALIALGLAGFAVSFLERELSWDGIIGIYFGQVAALFAIGFSGFGPTEKDPMWLRMLFLIPVNLAAACGGVAGALLADYLRRARPPADGRTLDHPGSGR